MGYADTIKGRAVEELLATIDGMNPDSPSYRQISLGIAARCTGDVVGAIKALDSRIATYTIAQERLASRIDWLNWIIAIATVIGSVAAILGIYH